VLGTPIAHSLSPVLHRAAYAELGLTGWDYRAVECTAERLEPTLRALEAEGLAGVALTMPLKRAALPLLARVERTAADLGVVNTVLFGGLDGDWWGTNTDVHGIVAALRGAGVAPGRRDVAWVLGAGATAASALAALAELGSRSAVVLARRVTAAGPLVRVGAQLGVEVEVRGWESLADAVDAPLVISTAPAGAVDTLADAHTDRRGRSRGVLFDVVYDPWPTVAAAAWERAGGAVIGGLALLVEQAAEQVRLMTGQPPPVEVMRAAGQAALASRRID
jgi:shikimate dehydrogenase